MGEQRTHPRYARTAPGVLTVLVLLLVILGAASIGPLSADPVIDGPVPGPVPTATPLPSITAEPQEIPPDPVVLGGDLPVALVLVLVLAALAFLVRCLPRFRPGRDPVDAEPVDVLDPLIARLVGHELPAWARDVDAALGSDAATDDVVIRCWLDFERLCAAAGAGRRAAQTTSDFARSAAGALDLPPQPLGTLHRLYQRARFGRHASPGDGDAGDAGNTGDASERELARESIRALSIALTGTGRTR